MNAHIEWLRGAFAPHYGFLRGLKENAEVRSYCGFTADDRGSFRVSAEGLSLFTELAIEMEIGLVFLGPVDSSEQQPALPNKTKIETAKPELHASGTNSVVAFQINGAGLDLSSISAQLGLAPSSAHRLGETDPSGRPYVIDSWSLVAPLPQRDSVDAHLRWLGTALFPHLGFLRAFKHRAEMLVRCDFGTWINTGGLGVSPEALRICTELGIALAFNAFLL